MSSELYLIRHGESRMNTNTHLIGGRSNESPLTDKGVLQARLLGEYLLANNILPSKVFVSPALRTRQTAVHTLGVLGYSVDPIVADQIQEMDQDDYAGRVRTEVYTPEVIKDIHRFGKDFKLPGTESMNDTGIRMLDWVHENVPISTSGTDRTFVFGHGMAIRCLASTLEGWSRQQTFEAITDNTSMTRFYNQNERWQLDYLGQTPHLSN